MLIIQGKSRTVGSYSGVARVSGAQGNSENWRPPEADMRTKKKTLNNSKYMTVLIKKMQMLIIMQTQFSSCSQLRIHYGSCELVFEGDRWLIRSNNQ